MKMNTKNLKQKIADNLVKHIIGKTIDEAIEDCKNPLFYHILTPEMAEKINDIQNSDDDYSNAIGRYVFISFDGEPMTEEEIFSFDSSQIDDSLLSFLFQFQDLGGFEDLSNWYYQDIMKGDRKGLTESLIDEIARYTIMEEMEKAKNGL